MFRSLILKIVLYYLQGVIPGFKKEMPLSSNSAEWLTFMLKIFEFFPTFLHE